MGKGIIEQISTMHKYNEISIKDLEDILRQIQYPKTPTESFRFDILDLSEKEIVKYPKKKLLWKRENL